MILSSPQTPGNFVTKRVDKPKKQIFLRYLDTFESSASYSIFPIVDILNTSRFFLNPQFPVFHIDCTF